MSVTATNINTGGAVVKVGGRVNASVNGDGYYDMDVLGTDVGCTTGGVTVTYSIETSDIFCDQATPPVSTSITGETATVEFSMLESTAENLKLALSGQASSYDAASGYYVGVGGVTTITFEPLQLVITDNDTSLLTTWTFFRCIAGGIEANFERENPTAFGVTFTAYAATSHASGKQLFQIKQAKA
jgi:uncharacterized protein involved in outer membrane biogenesis